MTLPDERTRAVKYARDFLRDLIDPSKTKRIPKDIRQRAYNVLKHFPTDLDIHLVSKVTDVFENPYAKVLEDDE